ncbi:hypothetical protein LCGC14_0856920 [marine sediment metagenome]|uniref:Uncharacterized protein n=1 Tax=marine sediment metagenome TaxID=412755 RepID=A0A0F9RT72_9ZZZZ
MITINFPMIGAYIWTALIVIFHLVRIGLILILGAIMSFYALMSWEEIGILVMFIIVITMTDWLASLYLGNWWKK